MKYVDGFVLPLPKKNLEAYRRVARKGAKIWRDHGALEYRECVGQDLAVKFGVPVPKQMKGKLCSRVRFVKRFAPCAQRGSSNSVSAPTGWVWRLGQTAI